MPVAGSSAPRPNAHDVPSDSILWLAADLGTKVNGEGLIMEWKSQSADGYIALSPTNNSAPKLVMDDDGRPWLEFDGADELVLPMMPAISELSFFAVANSAEPSPERRCPSLLHFANRASGTVTQSARLEFGRHMRELLYQVERKEVTVPRDSGLFKPMAPHVLAVIHGADMNVRLRVDSEQIHAEMASLPEALPRSFNYIGHNHYYSDNTTPFCEGYIGRIAEILLFGRGVSDDERDHIERYLTAKWGAASE